tara:strand:+ start:138 stop:737 length:600 start_codon:yes stop_codon:yes gene_type:complete
MKTRRRGAELEEALLEAAWQELEERGYAGLTMENIATRAGTSRPVIARRWSGKAELTIATLSHQLQKRRTVIADQGDLRAELLNHLEQASKRITEITALFSLFSSEFFKETSTTPQDLLNVMVGNRPTLVTAILERAVTRGEVDADKLKPPFIDLLANLFRGYAVMNFAAPPPDLRESWVDDIFLPLVRAEETTSGKSA